MSDVRSGEGQVLIVRGEAGIGKSALLEYLVGQADGCRVARAAGVESEMELPFAGLHQLCAPMLDLAGQPAAVRSVMPWQSRSAWSSAGRRTGSWSARPR